MRSLILLLVLGLLVPITRAGSDKLIIHEWGTFTSLQDETGRALGGINQDVEPLPSFVHDLSRTPDKIFGKGLPYGVDANITMRLETPVVYFYPGQSSVKTLDFSVKFQGGLLSQFYPDAKTNVPPGTVPPVSANSIGSLEWKNVALDTRKSGPKTDSHVWLAPRKVNAVDVTATNGESERYLFYRGVGNLDSPLKVVRHEDRLDILSQIDASLNTAGEMRFAKIWYFDMRADGSCAFTSFGPAKVSANAPGPIGWINSNFSDTEYSTGSIGRLRSDMHAALVADGLYDDEAAAMLNTWENSYFKSAGSRVFFIVPRAWTDHYLPINLSTDADVNRVMMGRVDLVTPMHRKTLQKLAATNGDPTKAEVVDLYKQLGRFGGAILRDEVKQRPSKSLQALVGAAL
jgi:hypothetical protein